ncbi:hypothetical protein [Spirosoma areae]
MSKPIPALFAEQSAAPFVFHSDTVPRRISEPKLSFRFNKGEIGFTKGLLELLDYDKSKRVAFVNFNAHAYLTRVDKNGHWLNVIAKGKFGITGATVCDKGFVQTAMRALGHGPGDVIYFPVASYPTTAAELGLDPAVYTNPFYRIVKDQKTTKG